MSSDEESRATSGVRRNDRRSMDVALLRDPGTIRDRCGNILQAGIDGRLTHFDVDLDALEGVAERVVKVTRVAYPDLAIPYHSRWNHFRAGGVDRVADFDERLAGMSKEEQGRARFDLAITSVLLDAGAGPLWAYVESSLPESTRQTYTRSEGLAVASYHTFIEGAFSSTDDPLRADAAGLHAFDATRLAESFQLSELNPLVGLEGRAALIRGLGDAVTARPDLFAGRIGGLFDHLAGQAIESELPAAAVLAALLEGLSSIWPGRIELDGENLGDVWKHPFAGGEGRTEGLVPFHKLSQWLTYSLLEPLEWAGLELTDLDALTGLAEYRNGGLFVDGGVIVPKDASALAEAHAPGSELVVEWRALTVALLDRVATPVREKLGKTAANFPLAKVLEGGTWQAGRAIAREKREDGTPPIRIESDGTVF